MNPPTTYPTRAAKIVNIKTNAKYVKFFTVTAMYTSDKVWYTPINESIAIIRILGNPKNIANKFSIIFNSHFLQVNSSQLSRIVIFTLRSKNKGNTN